MRKGRDKKGFVLLEAVLTVVILSVGLVVMIQSMLACARASSLSADYYYALHHMQNMLFKDFSRQPDAAETQSVQSPFSGKMYSFHRGHQDISRESRLNLLQLTASWQARNKPQTAVLETYAWQ